MKRTFPDFGWYILWVIAATVAAPVSYADALPPVFIGLDANGLSANGGFVSYQNLGETIASASASYDGIYDSSVSATANGSQLPSGSQYSVFASATVSFYLDLIPLPGAPSAISSVPVLFSADGMVTSTSTGTDFASDASVGMLFSSNSQYILAACAQSPEVTSSNVAPFGFCGLGSQSYSLDQDYPLPANSPIHLVIYADGSAGSNGYVTATLDPTIEIDPTWQYAADYELVASPSPSTVPEPRSVALLGAGLVLGLGAALRRRYTKRVPTELGGAGR